jgi:hypothetical protein
VLSRQPDPFWLVDSRVVGLVFWVGVLLVLGGLIWAVALMERRKHMALVNVGILLTSVMLLLLAGEVAVRVYQRVAYRIPLLVPMRVYLDRELGWEGRKAFGNPGTTRLKIFVVGDSFTNGLGLPVDDLYYSVLGRALDAEVFAYGGGGYGTLQELLVIERYLPTIKPDLVLLQVHSNDLINNQWELERASYFNNNLAVRPYLVGDTIQYRFPAFLGGPRLFMAAHSRLFYSIILDVERWGAELARRGHLHSVETDIETKGLGFAPFRDAVATTDKIVGEIKRHVGSIPLVAFPADAPMPYVEQLRNIFHRHEIGFADEVPAQIETEEVKGIALRLVDGSHWNVRGHAICGRVLAEWLARRGYLERGQTVLRNRLSRVDLLSSVPA